MRETLFKAKRIDNGEWVIGHYIPFGLDITIHYDIVFSKGDYIFCSESQQLIEINIKTLCQYTGLNDKNGNKIFEGDIIKHLGDGGTDIVVFENGRFTSKNGSYSLSETAKYNFEVIGNRWEKE